MVSTPNFEPLVFDLPPAAEIVISHFQPGTSQPRQSVKINYQGFVVNISRPVNTTVTENSFSVSDIPALLQQGIRVTELAAQLLQGDVVSSLPDSRVQTPSAASN